MASLHTDEGRRALTALVDFGRLVTRSAKPDDVLAALACAAVTEASADAAAALAVTSAGASRLVASTGLPDAPIDFTADADLVGEEIGDALLTAVGGGFGRPVTIPLVSGGGVFGSLVLLYRAGRAMDEGAQVLVEGLVDLAAAGLAGAAQYAELAQSYQRLRDSRAALERGEKLRALGQMAASVSHDLKNILNPLSLNLQYLRRLLPRDASEAQGSIAEMQSVLGRGVETLERLRAFSHQTPSGRPEPTELDRIAREALTIGRARAKTGVTYAFVEDLRAPPPVQLAAGEGVAALVNLVVNAIDAMPGGGTVSVATGGSSDGSWVRVSDDGPGMSPEVERRVFEPFFTTKGDEGTGLGLAMVYAFVRRHGGRIELETAPGRGASFTLWFPRDGA